MSWPTNSNHLEKKWKKIKKAFSTSLLSITGTSTKEMSLGFPFGQALTVMYMYYVCSENHSHQSPISSPFALINLNNNNLNFLKNFPKKLHIMLICDGQYPAQLENPLALGYQVHVLDYYQLSKA